MAGDWFDNPEEQRKRNAVYQQSGRPGLLAYDMVKGTGEGFRKIGRGVSGIGNWMAQTYKPIGQASSNFFAGAGAALNGVPENKPAIPTAQQNEEQQSPASPSGEPVALTETAKRAVQQPTAGGQTAATDQTANNPAKRTYSAGGLDFAETTNERGERVLAATDGSGGTARAVLHGGGNQQQSRPGLGLNGMRDLGNGQVAVGQVGGFQNPGYGFKGSREDAERFFQPVGRPGGYNPYKQRFRTLFDEQMDARRAAQNAPSPAEPQGPMGWKRLRDKMNNESRERIAEMTGGFGLDAKQMENALQRQRLAQEYGVNMAQLGNDTLRTQAALGLNGLQQMQTMQQMRQQQMLDNARYTLATADPNSDAYKRAERVAKAYEDGKERNFGFQTVDVDNGDGTTSKRIYVTDPSTGTVAPAQMAGGQGGEPYALDERQIAQAFSSPAGIKALQDGTWEKYLQDIREKAKKLKS